LPLFRSLRTGQPASHQWLFDCHRSRVPVLAIAFVLTIEEAAAPQSSLAFMFWGEGLFVFPLMLLYTAISYGVFRGKVRSTESHY